MSRYNHALFLIALVTSLITFAVLWTRQDHRFAPVTTTPPALWAPKVPASPSAAGSGPQDGSGLSLPAAPALKESAEEMLVDAPADGLEDVRNATLGFQKIYVLSMPTRSDKRDALALSAYLSGLEIEFVDGVDRSQVSDKAIPESWDMRQGEGTLGCWRGHMEIYQKMVRERIQTAMIWEDDVDWDVMVKAQLTEFARGTRYLQHTVPPTHSPYGDGWDVLSVGHCGALNHLSNDQDYWVIHDDPTVIDVNHRFWGMGYRPNVSPPGLSGNRTRLVFSNARFYCLASYAVSLQGAAHILYDQAILPNAKGIDLGIGRMCARRLYGDNRCLTAYPMLFGVHKPAGNTSKESDRVARPGEVRKVAQSENLVYPVRPNVGSLLKGETIIKAQWPEQAMLKEIDTSKLELPTGGPLHVTMDEYVVDPPPVKEASPAPREPRLSGLAVP